MRSKKAIQSIGQKIGVKWGKLDVDPEQLGKGIKTEQEHKDITKGSNKISAKIAMAHLKEDPKYYSKLEKMEETPKQDKTSKQFKRGVLKKLLTDKK